MLTLFSWNMIKSLIQPRRTMFSEYHAQIFSWFIIDLIVLLGKVSRTSLGKSNFRSVCYMSSKKEINPWFCQHWNYVFFSYFFVNPFQTYFYVIGIYLFKTFVKNNSKDFFVCLLSNTNNFSLRCWSHKMQFYFWNHIFCMF